MNLASRLHALLPDLAAAIARFPVPALLSLALTVLINLDGPGGSGQEHVMAGAAAAFLAAGSAHLFAEGRGLARSTNLLLAAAAAAVAGLLGYFAGIFETQYLFLFAALVPLVMIAPFLHDGARQGALWLFNLRFGLAALLATVVALAFAAGLSAIVGALDFLFGVSVFNSYEHIWATALALIGPLYGLTLMPRELDEEVDIEAQKGTLLERGVSVLVNYVLVPVIVIYALILHAYAVKIILEQALPKGNVAIMVSVFAIGGTGAWLIAWPWRDSGTKLLRLFMRGWFWLTIVPAILLAVAIWRRITDYGVTPDRYGIAAIALWIAAVTAYLAFRRNRADMRVILGAMAVLLLVGSAGPFGANGLTIKSQFARLESLLAKTGLLKDGKAIAPSTRPANEIVSEGYSIIYVLQEAGGLERLRPWFANDAKNPFKDGVTGWSLSNAIATYFLFDNPYQTEGIVSLSANRPFASDFTGNVQVLGPFQTMQIYGKDKVQQPMTAVLDETTLTIMTGNATYRLDTKDLAQRVKARITGTADQPAVAIAVAPDVTMVLDQLYGDLNATWPVNNARFWLIIRSGV